MASMAAMGRAAAANTLLHLLLLLLLKFEDFGAYRSGRQWRRAWRRRW